MRGFTGVLVLLMACGGGVQDVGPGVATTAGLSCSQATSCPAFTCDCADGTRWNAAQYCLNNSCQAEAATCANSCRSHLGVAFSSVGGGSAGGARTGGGSAGGGTVGATCSVAATCPAFACTCPDGTRWDTARYCVNSVCQGAAATCTNACRNNTTTIPTVVGCELRKWSNDHSVTMVTYGSASTESSAVRDAQSQCGSADWASWFCGEAADYCATENAVSYRCTFSKYATSKGRTVQYSGTGRGQTAAKRAAVGACIGSGEWRGWFCTSGSVTCSAL